jgi:hypothetical protein
MLFSWFIPEYSGVAADLDGWFAPYAGKTID